MEFLQVFTTPEAWIALATLAMLEIVLGVDNIIFISVLVDRLPKHQQQKGRIIGLGLAMGTRILLLLSLSWMMGLVEPIFTAFGQGFSGRDLILFFGGLFLLYKASSEIKELMSGHEEEEAQATVKKASFAMTLAQIAVIDIVFSLDSVITAVGMVSQVEIMIVAIVIAVGVMMFSAKAIGEFVNEYPSIKMLALCFLVIVGAVLVAESFEIHIPKGYIYGAMAFSLIVELFNIRMRRNHHMAACDAPESVQPHGITA
ncbi:MAG: TerC family protein [Burkholderiaceae bacterium]|uniref:TerC family protein n=1 Tax=Herminiimonas contaminans TaxID=1111140 RepID=A0ABS0EXC1_9BURK|nr:MULTISPECIES: TerC family protein [Oxalobacteraceae]MBF8178472.1 TerC family protein [Herminiimonas contaminans]MBX9800344.1 TerC family protein [Burkholderiaceae bacterium]